MPTEGIRKVGEAEEAAEDTVHGASDQADRILADGSAGAARRFAAAEDRARREVAQLRQQYDREAEVEIAAIDREAEKERERVAELARMHTDEAVKVVLEVIER